MPELEIQESHDEDTGPKVIYFGGFIDSSTAHKFREKLDEVIGRQIHNVIMDFTNLVFIGSAGISVPLEYASIFQSSGGKMVICAVPPKCRKVMNMVGLDKIVEIFETQKEAVESFTAGEVPPAPVPETKPAEPVKIPAEQAPGAAVFPADKTCPHCQMNAHVPAADIYRCHGCGNIFYVDIKGQVLPIAIESAKDSQKGTAFNLRIPSNIIFLNSVRAFVTSILGESEAGENDVSDIELALDEAVSNIMEHSYGLDKSKSVDISLTLTPEYFMVKLRDTGVSFDPFKEIEKETAKIGSKEKRGRGCYIIKQLMDKIEYNSIPGVGNEMVLLKYFQKSSIGSGSPQ